METLNMIKDEDVKAITIVKKDTKEIMLCISEDGVIVDNKEALIFLKWYNSDIKDEIIEKEGKFYLGGN